jgi:hypothetical protein
MPCGCTEQDIFVLYKFWRSTSGARDATLQIKKLEKSFRLEFADISGPSFDETIKKLLSYGIIAQLPKRSGMRFYAPNMGKVKDYLRSHGKNVDTKVHG